MSDYAFVHDGKAFTPNQTTVKVEDVATHNSAIEQAQLDAWSHRPDSMMAYYSFPYEKGQQRPYRETFHPCVVDATVSLWTGKTLGTIIEARVYRHNFGSRMVSMRIKGTNGATYYGRASYDWGQCIHLHKAK